MWLVHAHHPKDKPEGVVGPVCHERCGRPGPTADREPREDVFLGRGMRPLTWAAASGMETQPGPLQKLQHPWGSKEGRGRRKNQQLKLDRSRSQTRSRYPQALMPLVSGDLEKLTLHRRSTT